MTQKGILATIDNVGQIQIQPLGELNQAEFLGIGVYIINSMQTDLGLQLLQNHKLLYAGMKKILEDNLKDKESEQCSKESSSGSSPSLDSGQSTENFPIS